MLRCNCRQSADVIVAEHRYVLLEHRAGKHQTVVPPSVHPSGELIRWEVGSVNDAVPAEVSSDELLRATDLLAAASLVASIWMDHSRHHLALALPAFLAKSGCSEELAKQVILQAAEVAGDHELLDRERAITDTYSKHTAGAPVEGARKLLELMADTGQKVMAKLQQWLRLSPTGRDSQRPTIITGSGRDWHEVIEEAAAGLCAASRQATPELFIRGGVLVRLREDECGRPLIEKVGERELAAHLARTFQWFTMRRTANGELKPVPVQPSDFVVRSLVARSAWDLPGLRDVVEAPVFARSGELLTTPGYHPAARVWLRDSGEVFPAVSASPKRDEIGRARELLVTELLGDFPFDGDASRAHVVAAILLPFVREWIDGPTPLHLFDATTPGSGKGLLTDVVAGAVLGREVDRASAPKDDEEWRKRITALLRGGTSMVVIDNVIRRLESEALCAALTTMEWRDRVLGESTMTAALPNRALWIATGNNLQLASDVARRTVWTRLVPGVERPWERGGFRHPRLREWVRVNRGRLVWAALTLGRAWDVAGRPVGTGQIGSFEGWAAVLGGVLDVAGVPGFLGNYRALYEQADEEMGPWRDFVLAWAEQRAVMTVAELYSLAVRGELLGEVLARSTSERGQKNALERGLRRYAGRVIAGHRFDPVAREHAVGPQRRYRLRATGGAGEAP